MAIAETTTAPVIREEYKKVSADRSFALFTITKYIKVENRNGTNAVRESALFTAKMLEAPAASINSKSGRSNGVLLIITFFSFKAEVAKTKSENRTHAPNSTCFGKVIASVVKVTTARGNTKSVTPKIKREAFSR